MEPRYTPESSRECSGGPGGADKEPRKKGKEKKRKQDPKAERLNARCHWEQGTTRSQMPNGPTINEKPP